MDYFVGDLDFYGIARDDDDDDDGAIPLSEYIDLDLDLDLDLNRGSVKRRLSPPALLLERPLSRARVDEPFSASREALERSERRDYSSVLHPSITLHDYQKEAIHFGIRATTTTRDEADARPATGCMFTLDMGLGKTVVSCIWSLMMCNTRRQTHWNILIVCPKSMHTQWLGEFCKFTSPRIYYEAYVVQASTKYSVSEARRSVRSDTRRTVIIVSYGTMTSHFRKKRSGEIGIFNTKWDVCIFDEAHNLANRSTKKHDAAMALDRVNTCLLSGTPINNKVTDVLELMRFIGVAPSTKREEDVKRCLELYSVRVTTEQTNIGAKMGYLFLYKNVLRVANPEERRFHNRVNDLLIGKAEDSIDIDEALKQLEHKHLEISARHRDERSRVKREMLTYLQCARLACVAPSLSDRLMREFHITDEQLEQQQQQLPWHERWLSTGSATMRGAMQILDLAWRNGEKTLVFSRMVPALRLAKRTLDEASRNTVSSIMISGELKPKQRQQLIDRFQKARSKVSVCFLTEQSNGEGLNITAATRVLFLDPWYNPQKEYQALKRAHRIGQAHDVSVTWLVCSRSIAEAVFLVGLVKAERASTLLDNRSVFDSRCGTASAASSSSSLISELKEHNVQSMSAVNVIRLLSRFDTQDGLMPGNTEFFNEEAEAKANAEREIGDYFCRAVQ